jgi:hypothetical protein
MASTAASSKRVGGIWSKVNNPPGLQIHSVLYRFHPAVHWTNGYPNRKQIVGQVKELWKKYELEEKTVCAVCALRRGEGMAVECGEVGGEGREGVGQGLVIKISGAKGIRQ